MATRQVSSFCGACWVACASQVTIDDDDRIVKVAGDRTNPASRGYFCWKGLQAPEMHRSAKRVLGPMKRGADGTFARIDYEQAIDEIASTIERIVDRDGPEALAVTKGTGAFMVTATDWIVAPFMEALRSPSLYTDATIDQPSPGIAAGRLGVWAAGKPGGEEMEMALMFGGNPLVSHSGMGFMCSDPIKRLKEMRARGFKLIVVDPRATETARHADVFLQPYPGQDWLIAAGFVREILTRGWEDREFCSRWIVPGGLDALRRAVEPCTPERVAARAGVDHDDFLRAVELYATHRCRSRIFSGAGPAMSPNANLSIHMEQVIDVVLGRFRKEGDVSQAVNPWRPASPQFAEAISPQRSWEQRPMSRIRGVGSLTFDPQQLAYEHCTGERMAATLADEILTPGRGQVRALLNASLNLAASMPDQRKMVAALDDLELLVSLDPFWNNTSPYAHYLFPGKLYYERSDLNMAPLGMNYHARPFAAYTPAIVPTPPGSDIRDDWYFFWSVANRMGAQLVYDGVPLDMVTPPTTDDLLEIVARNGVVPFDVVKEHAGGHVFDIGQPVQAARPGATGTFDVMPDDVARELETALASEFVPGRIRSNGGVFTHLLAERRHRNIINSMHGLTPQQQERFPYNPVWIHPDDMARHGFADGDVVDVVSDAGEVTGVLEGDDTVKPGVVQMSHAWGGLPDDRDFKHQGSSVNALISTDRDLDDLTCMPRMSAIPVNLVPAPAG
jgi:anaerobic selenocysteine-containing dehydrogenase